MSDAHPVRHALAGIRKRLAKPRFLLVYPLLLSLFLTARITEHSLRIGIALIILGQTVRIWANGYVGHVKVNWTQKWRGDPKIGRLVTAGPYAFVRHPLYLGTLLIGAGFCVVVGSWWLSALAVAMFAAAYRTKMIAEETLLRGECGGPYAVYHAAVPRVLPAFRRYPTRQGRWMWEGLAASKEWKTVIWVTVCVVLLYFWEECVQEREGLFHEHRLARAVLLGLLLIFVAADGVAELVRLLAQRRQRLS